MAPDVRNNHAIWQQDILLRTDGRTHGWWLRLTQLRKVSCMWPILLAIDPIAAHCDEYSL